MAKSNSAPLIGQPRGKSTSSGGQLPLSRLLIDVKILRKKVKGNTKLEGREYEDFSNAVCRLYDWLDGSSIEKIEKTVRN